MNTRTWRIYGLAVAMISGTAGPALAHAELSSEVPKAGATINVSPSELDLTFTEGVDLAFTGVKVSGPDDALMGAPRMKAGGDTTLVVPLKGKLSAGTYTVTWHALSTDGHKTMGSYTFSISP